MTHSSMEPDQPPFLIELSPNTHSTLLAVTLHPLTNPQATLKRLLITPLEAVIHGHTYPFPSAIDPRSIHPSLVGPSDLVLRASALILSSHSDSTAASRPSIPLRAAHYWPLSDLLLVDFLRLTSSIECATCRSTLIQREFANVRTLPSSSWHDLVECWACHETKVVMPTSGHLGVDSASTVWVGAAHLVVHKEAVDAHAIEWDHQEADGEVKGKCAQCKSTLALRPRHVPDALHLLKSRVLAVSNGLTWSLPKVRAAMLLAEVLDQVTLHAAHKIALVDLDLPSRVVLELWTISWNCQVRTRRIVAKRAAKVLSREWEGVSEVRSVDDLPDGYGLVIVPDAKMVVDMLAEVNADLPESQRQVTMKPGHRPWQVSYLTA